LERGTSLNRLGGVLAAGLLPLLVAIVYAPGFGNEFVSWDDYEYIRENSHLRTLDGLRRIWTTTELPQYYPLTFTTHWIEYQLWGLDPRGYYAVSVALHALNALLVRRLIRALGGTPKLAWFVAAVFAVHPLQVASAGWMAERKTVLSGLFYLLTFLLYLRHRRTGRWWCYGLALVTFLAALLSKTVIVTLIPLLVLTDVGLLRRRWTGSVLRVVPLLLLAIGPLIVTAQREQAFTAGQVPLALRPLVAATALWFYVRQTLAPLTLLAVYPRWQPDAASLLWWLPLVTGVGVGAAAWLWRRRLSPLALWGLSHFVLTALPAVGLVYFGYLQRSPVADHLVYLALIGLVLALAAAVERVLAERRVRHWHMLANVAGLAALAALGTKTRFQVQVWEGPETLWSYVLHHNPTAGVAHGNLGVRRAAEHRYPEALAHFEQGTRYDPECQELWAGLASALVDVGRPTEAVAPARRAVELSPRESFTHLALGHALMAVGNLAGALPAFEAAAGLDPGSAEVRARVGQVLALLGRTAEALTAFEHALRLDPNEVHAHELLGTLLVQGGRTEPGLVHLQRAVALNPPNGNTHYMLAVALQRLGRRADALTHALRAVELQPADAEARALVAALRQE
jgi:Flp pilus assembly protein TadD